MRVANRLAALVVGIVLFAAGLLALVEGVLAATGRRPWPVDFAGWYGPLTRTRLSAPVVLGVSVAVGIVGLAVLFAEVRPWAPNRLSVRHLHGGESVAWWVHRRSVERQLSDAVDTVAGVSDTRVRLRGRRARWRVVVGPRGRADAKPEVQRVVSAQLDQLAAPTPVRLRIAMRRPKRVA